MLAITVFVSSVELFVIEKKFSFLIGGFLQNNSLKNGPDVLIFFFNSLFLDLVFSWVFVCFFSLFLNRCGFSALRSVFLSSYAFVLLFCFSIVGKYKVFSYFKDNLDFAVVKNMGGGDYFQAVIYAFDEIFLYVLLLAISIVIGWVLLRFVEMSKFDPCIDRFKILSLKNVVIIIFLSFSIFISNQNNEVRYGLSKKFSYFFINSIFSKLSDFDFDGYSYYSFPKDSSNFDGKVFPGALDVPENGIDEDGYFGDFQLENLIESKEYLDKKGNKYLNVFFIVLESVRADVVDKMVDGNEVAPNINYIVGHGTNISNAYTHTGFSASSNKIIAVGDIVYNKKNNKSIFSEFKQRGYGVSSFSGQDETFGQISSVTGIDYFSDYFFDSRSAIEDRVFPGKNPGSLKISEGLLVDKIYDRIDTVDWRKPQFFYMNFQAAHFPYSHEKMPHFLVKEFLPRSEISSENRLKLEKTYWNAVAYQDWAIGKIVSKIRSIGVYENTAIVIISDHGESLYDDNTLGHGHYLNDIQTKILMVINRPNVELGLPVGHDEIKDLTIGLSEGIIDFKNENDHSKTVFQYVGSLDNPSSICFVYPDGRRVVFDMRNREIIDSDTRFKFSDLDNKLDLKRRIQALVFYWEGLRWRQHIASD